MATRVPSNWAGTSRPALRRAVVLVLALLGLVAVFGGGSLINPQARTFTPARETLVGRTSSICTVASTTDPASTDPASPDPTPSDPAPADQAATSVTALGIRQAPGREGTLVGTPLNSAEESLKVTEQGKGTQLTGVKASVLLEGEGVMATAGTGAVFAAATTGNDAGLSAAPCLAPGTQQWFTGLGTGNDDRAELILSNPDDAQAEVDLRYYGRNGRVSVPGSPAVVVEAHTSRTVSLSDLTIEGPFSVEIQATAGRVAAAVRRSRTADRKPAGVDWQVPSTAPALTALIPTVPDGPGGRQLVVTNPGTQRATVQVQVLGLQGPFAPTGAATFEIGPESTTAVDLAPGLTAEAGGVKVTSDQPVTGSVVSTSLRSSATSDLAVQPATPVLVRTGVSAVATATNTEAELILSNGSDVDTQVSFEVLSLDGVTLRTDDVLLTGNSTATRRLTSTPPSYVVVRVPDDSTVVGGVVLTQPDGTAAGLATIPLTSPDLASRAPTPVPDPGAGR